MPHATQGLSTIYQLSFNHLSTIMIFKKGRNNNIKGTINYLSTICQLSINYKLAINIDPKCWGQSTINATQVYKPSYTTSYILIPNDLDNPTWLHQHRVSVLWMPHKYKSLAIQQDIYQSKLKGTIDLNTSFRGSGLFSCSKQ